MSTTLCTRLATRDLDAVQEEYFRELKELVEDYEDAQGLRDALIYRHNGRHGGRAGAVRHRWT